MTYENWTLGEKVTYAKGWNDAIKAAAEVVRSRSCGECDFSNIYAREIEALDRSMQATDD